MAKFLSIHRVNPLLGKRVRMGPVGDHILGSVTPRGLPARQVLPVSATPLVLESIRLTPLGNLGKGIHDTERGAQEPTKIHTDKGELNRGQ